ncbi:MAG: hydroxyacylglutathione hydrolase [Gammaproteobacteria bacterium]|nr:hydroxyacylglutathione hydrolase [Gammaproteobacteria bacterium]
MLKVMPIAAFKDNYIWLLVNPANRHCIVVDPGDAEPVIDVLKKENLILSAILITHHHHDHTGGILTLLEHDAVPVYGPATESIPGVDHKLRNDDLVFIQALDLELRVLEIPGHTAGHIAYYGAEMLFCGDTLFGAGCGRLFEGTAEEMLHSLTKISELPNNTLIYSAHEYTAANLRFAATVEPFNADIQKRIQDVATIREKNLPTLPSVLQLEKLTNPFLRCHIDSVVKSAQEQTHSQLMNPVDIFRTIRTWKDTF